MAIGTPTAKGSTSTKVDGFLTIAGVTLAAGETLIVDIVFTAANFIDGDVTWGANVMTPLTARAGSNAAVQSFYYYSAGGGTGDVSANFDGVISGVMLASGVTVLSATPLDKEATATGTSTTPSSGATATTAQADELLWGHVGTNGPDGDTAGSWDGSFTGLTRLGTTGGGATTNMTGSNGYRIVSATGTYSAAKSGITSREWCATIATFKAGATDWVVTAGVPGAASCGAPAATVVMGGVTVTAAAPGAASGGAPAATIASGGITVAAGVPGAAACSAPEATNEVLFYYPSIEVDAAVQQVDPWSGQVLSVPEASYRSTSRGVRVCGQPYLAAICAIDPSPIGGANVQYSVQLVLAIHEMPAQLASPDEVHWLFSQQDAGLLDPFGNAAVPREVMSLGITPNGRIVGNHVLRGNITSPIGVIRADGLSHQIRMVYVGDGSRLIVLDGRTVVQDDGSGIDPSILDVFFNLRFMLFNGLNGLTRCACTIYEAMYTIGSTSGLQSALYAMRWAMGEKSGAILTPEEYDSTMPELGWVPRIPGGPLTNIGDPGASYDATLQWFDPTALNFPRLYGNVPTSDPATCYKRQRRVPYTVRGPAATTFTPVGAP